MDGSIAFLTVKRDMNFIVETNLNTVCFGVIYCKDYFSHK